VKLVIETGTRSDRRVRRNKLIKVLHRELDSVRRESPGSLLLKFASVDIIREFATPEFHKTCKRTLIEGKSVGREWERTEFGGNLRIPM
jgi:hypothetical protein